MLDLPEQLFCLSPLCDPLFFFFKKKCSQIFEIFFNEFSSKKFSNFFSMKLTVKHFRKFFTADLLKKKFRDFFEKIKKQFFAKKKENRTIFSREIRHNLSLGFDVVPALSLLEDF